MKTDKNRTFVTRLFLLMIFAVLVGLSVFAVSQIEPEALKKDLVYQGF